MPLPTQATCQVDHAIRVCCSLDGLKHACLMAGVHLHLFDFRPALINLNIHLSDFRFIFDLGSVNDLAQSLGDSYVIQRLVTCLIEDHVSDLDSRVLI